MSADVVLDFRCCDTTWRVRASGPNAERAADAARNTAFALEAELNAFDPRSDVARLNRDGVVTNPHVARLVTRGIEYRERTAGVFDVCNGTLEHAVKAHIRGGSALVAMERPRAKYRAEGDVVYADAPLDLNGLAKGYIVDRAHATLLAMGATGFVDGGGDVAAPTGPVAIESPHDPRQRVGVLDTRWNVATSGRARRRRGAVDHLYDARDGRVGARHDQVTVLAQRDCLEADALATTLAVLPLEEGLALVESWPGAEALWVAEGRLYASGGFGEHVWKA